MPELVFELGCEELPASFVSTASLDLEQSILSRLETTFGTKFESKRLSTPRRLIVSVSGLPVRQEDSVKEVRGPAIASGKNADGQFTGAALGFCKGQGIDPSLLVEIDGYLWAKKQVVGQSTAEVLQTLLPASIKDLAFPKMMRWGSSRMKFARPIRWILAIPDGQAVEFELEGIKSGNASRGHRFYAPQPFPVRSFTELLSELSNRFVQPDSGLRAESIKSQAITLVQPLVPEISDDLLEENSQLTEWPTPICGEFDRRFLELPDPVLTVAMAKHEKMFPVRNNDGVLQNKFVFVRNNGEDETVRRGAEWVLNARLDDAAFFFEEDKKLSLAEFLEKTEHISFQVKLGSIKDRSERLHDLANYVASKTGASEEEGDWAARAGLYAKADLATGLVGELPELQGVIGAEYAARDGFEEAVCEAIRLQYKPASSWNPQSGGTRTSARVCLAEAIDKLAGFLGVGEAPSGSSDPYGLRRAASTIIELAWNWESINLSLLPIFERAGELYGSQRIETNGESALKLLAEVMQSRYQALLNETRYDALEAVLSVSEIGQLLNPREVLLRANAMTALSGNAEFVQSATRPINLYQSIVKKGQEITVLEWDKLVENLDSTSGSALASQIQEAQPKLTVAMNTEFASQIAEVLTALGPAIHTFFEETMVMAENPAHREARVSLVAHCCSLLFSAGDFSKLVSG